MDLKRIKISHFVLQVLSPLYPTPQPITIQLLPQSHLYSSLWGSSLCEQPVVQEGLLSLSSSQTVNSVFALFCFCLNTLTTQHCLPLPNCRGVGGHEVLGSNFLNYLWVRKQKTKQNQPLFKYVSLTFAPFPSTSCFLH